MNTQVGRLETASRNNAGTSCSPYLRNGVAIAVAMALALTYPQYAAAQSPNDAGSQTTSAGTGHADAPQQKKTVDPNRAQAATANQSPTQLGTITVTANKRSERLQDVPMAVSVLDSTRLDRENAVSFTDYAAQVPGLNTISSGGGQTQLVLRGITSGSQQNNASVATYINNAPFGSSTIYAFGSMLTPDIDPSEVQSIEVLKGPQGTLYGSNSLGGLVKFVTTPPDTTLFSGSVSASLSRVASSDTTGWRTHAMVNLPLVSDTLALRVNAYDRTDPGYIDNVATGKADVNETKVNGGRMQLLWTPSDKVSVSLSALLHNLRGDGIGNGGVDVDPTTLQPIYGPNQQKRAAGTGAGMLKFRLYDLSVSADFDWAKLISTTSYSTQRASLNNDQTALYAPLLDPLLGVPGLGYSVAANLALDKVSQEVRLQSPEDQTWEWRVGVFYTREHSKMQQNFLTSVYATGTSVTLPMPLL
ncbi:MAG TPA: TonB-dependent receptor plug domain-containing protein, partial [Oleiagrimonas sp.]|nr:TonB-dependent receptor plug domain-containing protein [Oleiagrimonas sp.]